jgi:hypothetical protein
MAGAGPQGQEQSSGPAGPELALFLRRAGANRIGARAFFTLEGYAGRNRETESALPAKCGKTPGHRPGSRLKLERRQTRSSNDGASVRVRDRGMVARYRPGSHIGLRAAVEFGLVNVGQ